MEENLGTLTQLIRRSLHKFIVKLVSEREKRFGQEFWVKIVLKGLCSAGKFIIGGFPGEKLSSYFNFLFHTESHISKEKTRFK